MKENSVMVIKQEYGYSQKELEIGRNLTATVIFITTVAAILYLFKN